VSAAEGIEDGEGMGEHALSGEAEGAQSEGLKGDPRASFQYLRRSRKWSKTLY